MTLLGELGPRFLGTPYIRAAVEGLERRLMALLEE